MGKANGKMNILFPFVGDSVGGSHISTVELIKGLKKKKYHVFVVLHMEGPLADYLDGMGMRYSLLPVTKLAGDSPNKFSILVSIIRNLRSFINYMDSNNIYLVHGNDLRINLTWSFPAKLSGRKFIWHQRTLLSSSPLWRLIDYISDYFIAISSIVMSKAPSNISQANKSIVYNPFRISNRVDKSVSRIQFCNKYGFHHDHYLVGYVGRLVDYKKIDFVIDCLIATDMYIQAGRKISFVIVGDGDNDYIDKLHGKIRDHDSLGNVKLIGFVTNSDSLIASLDLLVAPSVFDAFGRSIVEAMLHKTPVLASAVGGHLEIIENSVTGYLYDPDNCSDFIDKLKVISKSEVSNVTGNAYLMACERYAADTHVDNVIAIYNRFSNL